MKKKEKIELDPHQKEDLGSKRKIKYVTIIGLQSGAVDLLSSGSISQLQVEARSRDIDLDDAVIFEVEVKKTFILNRQRKLIPAEL